MISTEDQTYLGSYIPDYLLGMNMKFNYRNFTLSLDFQGQVGNDIYNGKKAVRPEIYNWETHVLDRWRPGIPSDTEPRINTSNNYNYLQSSYFVEDGSFLRLRNITLNYTLPSSLVSRFNIQNANLFLSGTNVFTLTEYSGYSPEIASNAVLSSGIDLGVYPITSIYTLGLNVTF